MIGLTLKNRKDMIISKLVKISYSLSWYNLKRWVKVKMNENVIFVYMWYGVFCEFMCINYE